MGRLYEMSKEITLKDITLKDITKDHILFVSAKRDPNEFPLI